MNFLLYSAFGRGGSIHGLVFVLFGVYSAAMDATTAASIHGLVFFTYVALGWAENRLTWRLLNEASLVALLAPRVIPVVGYVVLVFFFRVLEVASNVVAALLL